MQRGPLQRRRVRVVSQPSHDGLRAVPSKRALVLKSSYCPRAAGRAVRGPHEQRGHLTIGHRAEGPGGLDRLIEIRSMPVMTTDVGRLIA